VATPRAAVRRRLRRPAENRSVISTQLCVIAARAARHFDARKTSLLSARTPAPRLRQVSRQGDLNMKKTAVALALCLVATIAGANGPGRGDEHAGGGPGGPGGGLLVAADGTVYVESRVTSGTTMTDHLTAISSTGATLWTVTAPGGHATLSGTNLLFVTHTDATSTTAASSTITALSATSGATAWTLPVAGIVTELRPFSGGTYAIVVTPAATTGGTATRQLIAISNSGAVLWKATL
jgi:hypothetical protein